MTDGPASDAMETPAVAAPPQAPRSVAIIDDGFIPITVDRVPTVPAADFLAIVTPVAKDYWGVDDPDAGTAAEIFEAVTDNLHQYPDLFAELTARSPDLDRMLVERHDLKRLVALIEEQIGADVLECRPDQELPDLTGCDLVLIDYYLEGGDRESQLSSDIARRVRAQHKGHSDQQIVLMSSLDSVRSHRAKFREGAMLEGSAFAFIGKTDMDERWKVKAHLGMLDRARPHAPTLAAYRKTLADSLQAAKDGLLRVTDDLDIGDYAFLQSQALMSDGHPLGDYVSWLLASHFTTLAFETDLIRERQIAVDKLEFESKAFAPTEPSEVVGELFHSALFASNLGPLAPHPRAKAGGKYDSFPMVQLGDVFMDKLCSKAVVVLSADCDLAFSPVEDRAPDPDTPVLLVPGDPKAFDAQLPELGGNEKVSSMPGVRVGERVYRIDWRFSGYRSTTLGQLAKWLKDDGFDTSNRNRLRPLYGLKLQQEFGAHLLRVGPPIMPPLTYAAEGRLYRCVEGGKELDAEFTQGEVKLSEHKGQVILRLTPKLVHEIRRVAGQILDQLQAEFDQREESNKKSENLAQKIKALARDMDDDDLWIDLVNGMALNATPSPKALKSVCSFVRGTDWNLPGKPCVVFEIVEKARPQPVATAKSA